MRVVVPVAVALVVIALSVPTVAQTVSTQFNLGISITKPQAVISTTCAATPALVACPPDTKSQLHYLPSGATTVYLGLDSTVTSATGLPLAASGKQSWDVAGALVRCATASGTQTLYTLCGRGN